MSTNDERFSKMLEYRIRPNSNSCAFCLHCIEEQADDGRASPAAAVVKEHFADLRRLVRCSRCSTRFHEVCASLDAASGTRARRGASAFECDNCRFPAPAGTTKTCALCRNAFGALKSVDCGSGPTLFAHPVCLFFSGRAMLSDVRNFTFSFFNPSEVVAQGATTNRGDWPAAQDNCQLCRKAIVAGDGFFKCYCLYKAHISCMLYLKVATLDSANNDAEAERIPIAILNEPATVIPTPQRLSLQLANLLLQAGTKEGAEQPECNAKMLEHVFQTSSASFNCFCPRCVDAKTFYCCHTPLDENLVQCGICTDWFHQDSGCAAYDKEDERVLETFARSPDAPPAEEPPISRRGRKNGRVEGARAKKRKAAEMVSMAVEDIENSYFACKACYNVAATSLLFPNYPIRFLPNNFLQMLFLQKMVNAWCLKSNDKSRSALVDFRSKVFLRMEFFEISQQLIEMVTKQAYTGEIERFEFDIRKVFSNPNAKMEEVEILRTNFHQNIRKIVAEKSKKSTDKSEKIENSAFLSFYTDIFGIIFGYMECKNSEQFSEIEKRTKKLFANRKTPIRRAILKLFVNFLNKNFLENFAGFLKSIEPIFENALMRVSSSFEQLLKKEEIAYVDVVEFFGEEDQRS